MKIFVIVFLILNIFANSIFNSFASINSDTVWSYLLFPNMFKNLVYLAPDTFVLHYPISYLLVKLIGWGSATVILDTFLLVIVTSVGWLIFYFYFLRKHMKSLRIIYILPAFLFINFSQTFYQTISIPSLRNIEFSFALILLIYFDSYLLLYKRELLKLCIFLAMFSLFISDPYFIYVFAIPLFLILFIRSRNNSRYWDITGLLFITITANTIIRNLLNKTQYFMLYGVNHAHLVFPNKIISNIDLTIKGLLSIIDSYPKLHITSFLFLILFLLGVYGLWLMFKKGLEDTKHVVLLLLPLCFVFTILAYVSSGQPTDLATSRYLIFIVFILPVGICYAISRFSSKYVKASIALGLAVLSSINFFQMYSTFKSHNNPQQYLENQILIKTIQQYGLFYGYTSYWNAGINTFLSGNKSQFIQVRCVNHRIQPHKWLASKNWFDSGNYVGKTFLMIDYKGSITPEIAECSLKDITNQFGKPAQMVTISYYDKNMSLIIFDYNIASKF